LHLTGPKGRFPLGRLTGIGHEPRLDGQRPNLDVIHLQFRNVNELAESGLQALLKEHLAAVTAQAKTT
jgi:hypothetical protein